ncbi:MAG: transglycosylase domain-containing protein [Treponema sp.]
MSGALNKIAARSVKLRRFFARRFSARKKRFLRAAVFIAAFVSVLYCALRFTPEPALTRFCKRQYSARFYDKNGILLHVMPLEEGLRREFVPLKKIPPELVDAFIAAEDKNFYRHSGVDFLSIIRAAEQNRKARRVVSGASTITMQLVRLIYPRTGRADFRVKLREMFCAFRLEVKLSKKRILELYLNNVPFGFQTEGIASAARSFYGVGSDSLSSLTAQQMKTLALIPRRPAEYAPQKTFVYPNLCPHFIQYVKNEYKKSAKSIPSEVRLTVDSKLVERIERGIQQKLDEFKDARIHNGAALVINNRTGEIIAWAGNASFDDAEHSGQIDGVLVKNQPGSSMKPFLYALALENGFEPSAVLPDIPQDFGSEGVYVPQNFNNRFNGPVRFRVALASSLNVPAVYLLNEVGIGKYMDCLSRLGFASLEGTREGTGLSLALGSGEVTLFEMTKAFSVFTRGGSVPENLSFLPRKSAAAKVSVFQPDTARIICDILSDKDARSLGFGHAKVFDTPYPCIFKTGTSNQFQNIVAFASTSEFTTGVWMGNFEGETIIRKTGSSIPAEIARAVLDVLTKTYGAKDFPPPEFYEKRSVCALSGLAVSDSCPSSVQEFVRKNARLETCLWHQARRGGVNIVYPPEYAHWAAGKNMRGKSAAGGALKIVYPKNKAVFIYDASLNAASQMLPVHAVGGKGSTELLVDGKSAGASDTLRWHIPLTRGRHELIIRSGEDEARAEYTVEDAGGADDADGRNGV